MLFQMKISTNTQHHCFLYNTIFALFLSSLVSLRRDGNAHAMKLGKTGRKEKFFIILETKSSKTYFDKYFFIYVAVESKLRVRQHPLLFSIRFDGMTIFNYFSSKKATYRCMLYFDCGPKM